MARTPIKEYADLRRAIADRIKDCGLSHLEMDSVAGFCDGYTGKLMCNMRSFGEMSLPTALDALGLELVIEPDPDALPPEIAQLLPVDHRPQRPTEWIAL